MADTEAFDAAAAQARAKPIPFPPFHGQQFRGRVPGGLALLEFIAAGDLDTEAADPAEVVEANRAALAFLQALLVKGDWSRFRRVCADHQVSTVELGELLRSWMAVVAARPTQQSSVSGGEPSSNGIGSRDVVLSPGQ